MMLQKVQHFCINFSFFKFELVDYANSSFGVKYDAQVKYNWCFLSLCLISHALISYFQILQLGLMTKDELNEVSNKALALFGYGQVDVFLIICFCYDVFEAILRLRFITNFHVRLNMNFSFPCLQVVLVHVIEVLELLMIWKC